MKDALRLLFNIFWVLLVGISAAISNFFMGVACCLTIIGIPFGLQYFKFIKLAFAPAGKVVVNHFMKHPVMNALWLIFGGLATGIFYLLLALVLLLTVVGYPLAVQLFKIAMFNFAPFGCEVLQDGEYSSERNTEYDYSLLTRRIVGNPDLVIGKKENGEDLTTKDYLMERQDALTSVVMKQQYSYRIRNMILLIPVIFSMFIVLKVVDMEFPSMLIAFGCIMAFALSYVMVSSLIFPNTCAALRGFYDTELRFLMDYYPKGSKEKKFVVVGDSLAKCIGVVINTRPGRRGL